MPESQENQKGPELDEESEKFINEFLRMRNPDRLKAYEAKNRGRLLNAPLPVGIEFDRIWREVFDQSYLYFLSKSKQVHDQAEPPSQLRQRVDPKSNNYRVPTPFSDIWWEKTRKKVKKRWQDYYSISGTEVDSGLKRHIFTNLRPERLKNVLNEEISEEILNADAKIKSGYINRPITILAEGFWEVEFSHKRMANDPDDVTPKLEGMTLIMKRRTPVILPGFMIETIDHATWPHFSMTVKEGRKKDAHLELYPKTVLRQATFKEYIKMKEDGDRKRMAMLEEAQA